MKKLIYISFLTVYLLMTVGFSVAHHFCGNFVMDVTINSLDTSGEPEDCCPESCGDDCCKDEFKTIKILDSQLGQSNWKLIDYQADIVLPDLEVAELSARSNLLNFLNPNSSPPVSKTYLINRSLLI